jgi:hypothetical protein
MTAIRGARQSFKILLPDRIDNPYQGSKLGPWLFCLILFLKLAIWIAEIAVGRDLGDDVVLPEYEHPGGKKK